MPKQQTQQQIDRTRIRAREIEFSDAFRAAGRTNPLLEPNGTHSALWHLAEHLGLATAAEVAEAARVLDWQWSYTGD